MKKKKGIQPKPSGRVIEQADFPFMIFQEEATALYKYLEHEHISYNDITVYNLVARLGKFVNELAKRTS